MISNEGVLPNPDNIAKLADWPVPQGVRDVRSFLGLGNYYRRFVKNYSSMVKPLTELTKKDKTFQWTKECQTAFDNLKAALLGPEIMAYPDAKGSFVLDTDACDVSIGAVLSQVQDGRERVIAYGSQTLNKAERNYCVTDKELLAVKFFIEYYKHYLTSRHFTVRTDHQALKWLFSLKEPKQRLARWIEVLSTYDFEIEYRPGQKHGNADALSRCPNPQHCECPEKTPLKCGPCKKCCSRQVDMQGSFPDDFDDMRLARVVTPQSVLERFLSKVWVFVVAIMMAVGLFQGCAGEHIDVVQTTRAGTWVFPYSSTQLGKIQRDDPDIGPVLTWKENGERPSGNEINSLSPATKYYWLQWDSLVLQRGQLFRKASRCMGSGDCLQFLVPKSLQAEVIRQTHNVLLGGHLGFKKTLGKIRQRYHWYGLHDDVKVWVAKCDTCGAVKKPPKIPRAPLGKVAVSAPFDCIAADILGPLPLSRRGNKYVLVVTDLFSKWVEAFPLPDQTAESCAQTIANEVIARYGCPYSILTDQGRNFESNLFAELCELLEIRKIRTSPGHPQGNGQTERFNRTLLTMIKSFLGREEDWDLHLGCLTAAYRASPHESTGMTPNMLMFGHEVRLPVEVLVSTRQEEDATSYGDYVSALRSKLQRGHEIARKHLAASAIRQKEFYDSKGSFHSYTPGNLVWYAGELSQLHLTPKLRSPYEGPFLILKRVNDLNYVVQFNKNGVKKVVHHNKLKPYTGNKVLKWAKPALRKFH